MYAIIYWINEDTEMRFFERYDAPNSIFAFEKLEEADNVANAVFGDNARVVSLEGIEA